MHNQDRHEILSKFELLTLVYFCCHTKLLHLVMVSYIITSDTSKLKENEVELNLV